MDLIVNIKTNDGTRKITVNEENMLTFQKSEVLLSKLGNDEPNKIIQFF